VDLSYVVHDRLRRIVVKTVLFLCTGNYYRSRFAEIYFNWLAQDRGLAWRAESRGLALDGGNPGCLSRHTVAHLTALGISSDDYQRFALPAAANDFLAATLVVAVKEAEHRPLLQRKFPQFVDRVEFWKVNDIDCAGPEEALPHLEREVLGLLDRLTAVAAA
jgi:protein-tyrosine phosphatase